MLRNFVSATSAVSSTARTAFLAAIALFAIHANAHAQTFEGPLAQQQPVPSARAAKAAEDPSKPDIAILPDQGAARGLIVTDRTRPEYLAQGVPVGSFRFLPEISVSELYNDNIYATENNKTDDFVTIIQPRLSMRSDWNRHALNFSAASASGLYSSHSSENYDDYLLQADGKVDVTRRTTLGALVSYSGNHEERGSPNDQRTQTDPVAFTVRTAQAETFHAFNRVKFDVIYSNQDFQYDNGNTKAGAKVNNGIRDRMDNEVTGRVSYIMTPSYDLYLQSAYNNRDYSNTLNKRSSDGYNVYAGLHADLTGKLFGDIYAGYMEQNYDNSVLYKDFSGAGYGVNGYWNMTSLTSLTANVGRDVQETIVAGASSYVETRARLNLDHEVMRNVILSALIGYNNDDYQGTNRKDDVWVAGGGMRYLINRNLSLFANYNHIDRNSNQNNNDYQQNRVLLGLKAAL